MNRKRKQAGLPEELHHCMICAVVFLTYYLAILGVAALGDAWGIR